MSVCLADDVQERETIFWTIFEIQAFIDCIALPIDLL